MINGSRLHQQSTLPRLLLIDYTPISGSAATSTLKAAHFQDWPKDRLLQVTVNEQRQLIVTDRRSETLLPLTSAAAELLLSSFAPELILYRPVADHPQLRQSALGLIEMSEAPLALWLMDDWPERLMQQDPVEGQKADKELQELFRRASLNFAISPGMAEAFGKRYSAQFVVARNVVDPNDWPQSQYPGDNAKVLRVRYAGALAPDMGLDTVRAVAELVSSWCETGKQPSIVLEIRSRAHWLGLYGHHFEGLKGVSLLESDLSAAAYRQWLTDADILLVAYNFDPDTHIYLRYSFANKVPETLASGTAVLAVGPPELETISFLAESEATQCVQELGPPLEAALAELVRDPSLRQQLGQRGREVAFRLFSAENNRKDFRTRLQAAAKLAGHQDGNSTKAVQAIRRLTPLVTRIKSNTLSFLAAKFPAVIHAATALKALLTRK